MGKFVSNNPTLSKIKQKRPPKEMPVVQSVTFNEEIIIKEEVVKKSENTSTCSHPCSRFVIINSIILIVNIVLLFVRG